MSPLKGPLVMRQVELLQPCVFGLLIPVKMSNTDFLGRKRAADGTHTAFAFSRYYQKIPYAEVSGPSASPTIPRILSKYTVHRSIDHL